MRLNSEQITKAVASVKERRPAYSQLLNFYERLFTVQENSLQRINLTHLQIPDEILRVKQKEKFHLVEPSELSIDVSSSKQLLIDICQIALHVSGNSELPKIAQTLLNAIDNRQDSCRFDPASLFHLFFKADDSTISDLAKSLKSDASLIAYFIYNSIKPSIALCAEQLSGYLRSPESWEKGYCPICGSYPGLSILSGQGERVLICGICWHSWQVQRIFCPFCENRKSESHYYIYSEDENDCRVDACENCKGYIKTVDIRKNDRIFYAPLEYVSTLHLDILAKEDGLENKVRIWV